MVVKLVLCCQEELCHLTSPPGRLSCCLNPCGFSTLWFKNQSISVLEEVRADLSTSDSLPGCCCCQQGKSIFYQLKSKSGWVQRERKSGFCESRWASAAAFDVDCVWQIQWSNAGTHQVEIKSVPLWRRRGRNYFVGVPQMFCLAHLVEWRWKTVCLIQWNLLDPRLSSADTNFFQMYRFLTLFSFKVQGRKYWFIDCFLFCTSFVVFAHFFTHPLEKNVLLEFFRVFGKKHRQGFNSLWISWILLHQQMFFFSQ